MAVFHGGLDPAGEKRLVDLFVAVEGPDPGDQLGIGGIGGTGQKVVFGVENFNGFARSRFAGVVGDRAGEDPDVAAQQGFFTAGIEFQEFVFQWIASVCK